MKYNPVTNKKELKIDWYDLSEYSSSDLQTLKEFINKEQLTRDKNNIELSLKNQLINDALDDITR